MRFLPDVKTTLPVAISLWVSVNSSTWSAANDWSPQSISTWPISLMWFASTRSIVHCVVRWQSPMP